MDIQEAAIQLIKEFKGSAYAHGTDVLRKTGRLASELGSQAAIVRGGFAGSDEIVAAVRESLDDSGVTVIKEIPGAAPNAPREDLRRIRNELASADYDVLVSVGGGSTIDAAKAADVLAVLGGEIDDYFGTGAVSAKLADAAKSLNPHVAVQTVASSAAHLTKYSNITDIGSGQKKLIVDEAIVPPRAVFDYAVSRTTPTHLTMDGALDGVSHLLEVLYGAVGKPDYAKIEEVATTGIRLIVENLRAAVHDRSTAALDAIALATDLGGYAIMLGGTNGGHLTSFSLVDVLSHGRACAMMNPYYTVFFAPAIERPLRAIAEIYADAGVMPPGHERLHGRDLGEAVAHAMIALAESIGFPTRLAAVKGFSDAHIDRALEAAKNPQLEMKLRNMPIAMDATMVDTYMRSVLEAARDGKLSHVMSAPVA